MRAVLHELRLLRSLTASRVQSTDPASPKSPKLEGVQPIEWKSLVERGADSGRGISKFRVSQTEVSGCGSQARGYGGHDVAFGSWPVGYRQGEPQTCLGRGFRRANYRFKTWFDQSHEPIRTNVPSAPHRDRDPGAPRNKSNLDSPAVISSPLRLAFGRAR
jgi:hypothetical protein